MHNKKIQLGLLGAITLLLSQAAQAAPAAIDKGSAAFAAECSVCHAVKADVQGMMGPNLAGVPGTYMPYAGMADAASRDAGVCFLSQQS